MYAAGACRSRLPRNVKLDPDRTGWNFYLCVRKDLRIGKGGEYLALVLQDASGQVAGRVFENVERLKDEFEAGEFVRVEGRTSIHNGELQLVITSLRRVHAAQDEAQGFREEDCVPSAPRPIGDMWSRAAGAGRPASPTVRCASSSTASWPTTRRRCANGRRRSRSTTPIAAGCSSTC